MIVIVGLTNRGVAVARNPQNPNDAEHQVLSWLYSNNNQATKDTICQYKFGGDIASCNTVLKSLKRQRLIAYDVGNEL